MTTAEETDAHGELTVAPGSETTDPDDVATPMPAAMVVTALQVPGSLRELHLTALPGEVTLWQADDSAGSAEFVLALAGRYRTSSGRILILDREADPPTLRREVVISRVVDVIEPEPRLTVGEYLASCRALHGVRHLRIGAGEAMEDVGLPAGSSAERIEDLSPADNVRVCVAGALLSRPVAVVVDRIDRGLTTPDWHALLADVEAAANRTGVAIVAGSTRSTEGGDPS